MKTRVLAKVLLLVTAAAGTATAQEPRPKVTIDPRVRDRLPEMVKTPLPEVTTVRVPISGGNSMIRDIPPVQPPPPLDDAQAAAVARASTFRSPPPTARARDVVARPGEFILSPRNPHVQNAGSIGLIGACAYYSESPRDYNDGFGWVGMGSGSIDLSLYMQADRQYLIEFSLAPRSDAPPVTERDPTREYVVRTEAGSQTLTFSSDDQRIVLLTDPASADGWGVIRVSGFGEPDLFGCREGGGLFGSYLGDWTFYRVTVRRLD